MGKTGALAGSIMFLALVAATSRTGEPPPPLRRSTTIAVHAGPHGGRSDAAEAARLYNEACERARAGEADEAVRLLIGAIRAGFNDISHLCRDPDLRAIRGHDVFRAILAARDAADPLLSARRVESWRTTHEAQAYRYEADAPRRISFASALDDQAHAQMRRDVEALWDHLAASLFPPTRHEFLVVLPTASDARAILPDTHAHGHYSHGARQLIAREPGRALLHEIVHAMHHGHMDSLGQEHPAWIQEGLACLYEAWETLDDGTVAFPPNDRDQAARALAAAGRLLDWPSVMQMSARDLSRDAARTYPQLRSMMRFIAEAPGITGWYHTYTAGYDADPTGRGALEAVLGGTLADLEDRWRLRLLADE